MKKTISLLLKYGIPILISVGLAWFLYNNVDLKAIGTSLEQDVNYWWFIPVIVVSIFSHVFRAYRWRLQLRAIGLTPPLHALVCSIFGTYFVNLLFPRLGEVWRTGYIARREKAPFTTVLGTMVGDRLSDTLVVALLTLVTFFLAKDAFLAFMGKRGDGVAQHLAWVLVAALVLGGLALWLVMRWKTTNRAVNGVQNIVRNLWQGFSTVLTMEGKWWFLLYTVLIWLCYFIQLYIASLAFKWRPGTLAICHHLRPGALRRGRVPAHHALRSSGLGIRLAGVGRADCAAHRARHLCLHSQVTTRQNEGAHASLRRSPAN